MSGLGYANKEQHILPPLSKARNKKAVLRFLTYPAVTHLHYNDFWKVHLREGTAETSRTSVPAFPILPKVTRSQRSECFEVVRFWKLFLAVSKMDSISV